MLTREADIPWQGDDMVRLPDQPPIRVRELGPRSLDEVPLDEIAELVKLIRGARGTSDPTELKVEKMLRSAIRERTGVLGQHALDTEPEHLVGMLGRPGERLTVDDWSRTAGLIEGYRERWRVAPDRLFADFKNPTRYSVAAGQASLGLPSREYYLSDDPKMVALRAAYRNYIVTIEKLAGRAD